MDPWPAAALALAISGFGRRGMRRELFLGGCPVERIDDLVDAALVQVPPRPWFHAGTVFGWVLIAIPLLLMVVGIAGGWQRLIVVGLVLAWVLGAAGFALVLKGRSRMGGGRRFQCVRRPMW